MLVEAGRIGHLATQDASQFLKLSGIPVLRHREYDAVQPGLVGRLVLLQEKLHLQFVGRGKPFVQAGGVLHGAEIFNGLKLDRTIGAVDADAAAGLGSA